MARKTRIGTGVASVLILCLIVHLFIGYHGDSARSSWVTLRKLTDLRRDFWVDGNPSCQCPKSIGDLPDGQNVTIIIPTIGRKTLTKTLKHYLPMKRVHKILVYWFSVNMPPPSSFKLLSGKFNKLVVEEMSADDLMLRFQPNPKIETQAVFSIDDDVLIHEKDLNQAIHVWKRHQEGLIGFSKRHFYVDQAGSYKYYPMSSEIYSMILTKVAIYDKRWHQIVQDCMPKQIMEYVKEHTNCEDIAINFLISQLCPRSIYYSENKHKLEHAILDSAISMKGGHYEQRDKCMELFVEIFHGMPLQGKLQHF